MNNNNIRDLNYIRGGDGRARTDVRALHTGKNLKVETGKVLTVEI